jgi:hypothetical protein
MKRTLTRRIQRAGRHMPLTPEQIYRLTLDTNNAPDSPWVGDSTPFFSQCDNGDLISLHFGGRMGLLDLFDWQVSQDFQKEVKYLTWVRPAYSGGNPTAGHLSDPCADPNGFEYGAADLIINGFGRYGRMAPVREILKPTRFCEMQPRVRLDGTRVTSEFEWDLAFIVDTIRQDLFRHVITGNDSTAGQFDGLQQWINTGFPGNGILDSMVIDWNGNDLDGAGGGSITVNGNAVNGTPDIVDVLLAIYRRYKQRIMWSPLLAGQDLREGAVVLVLPTFLAECLLDKYTCWSVCEGRQYNEANLQTFEARQFRNSLLGGLFGAGSITLDGDRIHLFAYDWETIHGNHRGDIYFLTLSVGNMRLWQGEILDAQAAAAEMRQQGHNQYFVTDGGRVLGVTEVDNLCRQTKAWIRPRLYCIAPWLQARIMDVECVPVLDPLSPDPLSTSFYPVTSFAPDIQTVG